MKVNGVIVEYNPLHNGHIYHLNKTKELTSCDYVVAVMSGNFVQRGEPAFVNKWARTNMALLSGIDLVLELPTIYSISSAEGFAFGAISILDKLGIIDTICFGSESGNISELMMLSKILAEEPQEFKISLEKYLKLGISFPAAREKALHDFMNNNYPNTEENSRLTKILNNSNNILAIEYLKSLHKLSSNISAFTIPRINNRYNEENLTGNISSATSIRKNLLLQNNIKQSIPDYVDDILQEEIKRGCGPLLLNNFSDIIMYKLRTLSIADISEILDVSEGLENKIKKACENTTNINDLIELIKTKRYTTTRLQRILIYTLLDIKKDALNIIKSPAKYVRVLGFNDNGKKLLKEIKKRCPLPIITNPSANDIDTLKYDISATDIYVLGYSNNEYKEARQDLKKPPIYCKI
ncbi:hypothetical protein Q428_03205 [Fervidicella metallireducens AeB]|uniref:tRNA(Met) cytidine acetate ligase n=1 Tax=Fervidicella metallireducens AeB TaxID=1403537 RepID=A0A017RX80_9CLOT|nr:nucleotidyltransferase [Fervidicella metallireducens]EYE89297.1 hypothetical protein Q428_03205 [Fervidicella metallireducens AeB]